MPFIGVNPPTARVTNDSGISSQVDATPQNQVGHVAFFKDGSGRISVLAYAQAQASIPLGAALMHQAGGATTLNSAGVSTLAGRDPGYVDVASTGMAGWGNACAGIAAAAVSNTGYYFWRYINGYCPDVALPTNYASGTPMRLSGTYAGRLSSAVINASIACAGVTIGQFMVAMALGAAAVTTANSTNSAVLYGWYL